MPKFFLRFHDGDTVHPDDDGEDFPDIAAAHAAAVRSGREIMQEHVFDSDAQLMRYDIVDEAGQVVDTVQLSSLV